MSEIRVDARGTECPESDEAVMELAISAGRVLLENGAEIFRAEDTVRRIYTHYGVTTGREFVLTNGVFVSAGSTHEDMFARVESISQFDINMEKITAVNELSRDIEDGRYTVREAMQKLESIKKLKGKSLPAVILASGAGSAAFCYILDSTLADGICAFAAGSAVYAFILFADRIRMSKLVRNVIGAIIVTVISWLLYMTGVGAHLNPMIIGSIMPLIPGVAFTNAIRDIADGNYLSGTVRLLDAVIIFTAIAIGVSMGLMLINRISGVIPV